MTETITSGEPMASRHSPMLSIVIPTHNRSEILLKALRAYSPQAQADRNVELVVIDDGSTDGTVEAVQSLRPDRALPLRYIRQRRQGQASARNRGIRESRGDIILFTDDDIIPCSNLVAEHLAWHRLHPGLSAGVLGQVLWSPEVNPTPFMEWLGQDGVVCGYRHLRKGQELSHGYFYSGNISLKKGFLIQNGLFDEDFTSYGCEDVELGERLMKKGLCLFYNPDAIGYHYKKMLVADVWRRAELVESSRQLLRTKFQGRDSEHRRGVTRTALRVALRSVLPPLAPVIRLFDTPLPLPWSVYRAFYFHYMLPVVRKRLRVYAD